MSPLGQECYRSVKRMQEQESRKCVRSSSVFQEFLVCGADASARNKEIVRRNACDGQVERLEQEQLKHRQVLFEVLMIV